jgi:hypothetical protein
MCAVPSLCGVCVCLSVVSAISVCLGRVYVCCAEFMWCVCMFECGVCYHCVFGACLSVLCLVSVVCCGVCVCLNVVSAISMCLGPV